jgi:hypothetical protein
MADRATSHTIDYLPLDDTVTVVWPDGPTTYPAEQVYAPGAPVWLEPVGHGVAFDFGYGTWSVLHNYTGPHTRSYRCHGGNHWRAWRVEDAATAAQLWDDRDQINRIVRDTGQRDLALTVLYRDDYAAVLEFRSPYTFFGAFTYPAGSRHVFAEPRPRHPAKTAPEGTRLPLAALPVGARLTAPRPGGPRHEHPFQSLVIRARHGSRTVRPNRPAPVVVLALAGWTDGQRVDPADEVTVTAGRYVMDHWPHTLPDPTT